MELGWGLEVGTQGNVGGERDEYGDKKCVSFHQNKRQLQSR